MKDKFTFFPDRITTIPEHHIPDFATELWISTRDGESIQSFLFRKNPDINRSIIIYFHGNGGNLYSRFDSAIRLAETNHDVLLVSYPGYAKSTGSPSEMGIYMDGESAINYARDELGYREQDITIFGRSLGSAVAVHVAQERRLRSVILVTPFTSGKDMAIAMGLGLFKFLAGDSYNSLEKINNLQTPLLIIHGDRDEVVPYKLGVTLYQAFKGPKHMVTIAGGGHNDLQMVDPNLYWGEIERFLQ